MKLALSVLLLVAAATEEVVSDADLQDFIDGMIDDATDSFSGDLDTELVESKAAWGGGHGHGPHGHSGHGHRPHGHNPHGHNPHRHHPHRHTPYPPPNPTPYPPPYPTPFP